MRVATNGRIREHIGTSHRANGLLLVKTDIGETAESLSKISLISSHLHKKPDWCTCFKQGLQILIYGPHLIWKMCLVPLIRGLFKGRTPL